MDGRGNDSSVKLVVDCDDGRHGLGDQSDASAEIPTAGAAGVMDCAVSYCYGHRAEMGPHFWMDDLCELLG